MSVALAATTLVSGLKLVTAWSGFHLLRFAERLLPTALLSLLLWPFTTAWDALQLRKRTLLTCWRRFPESWRPSPRRFFLRQSLGLCHPKPLYLWPDRLGTPRWLNRCQLEGGRDLIGSRDGDRGVILATLHFGPFELLPYWLRAHGIATTMIRGATPVSLQSLTRYQHSLSPPADLPVFLDLKDMTPVPRFKHAKQLLGPGRRLLLTVDVDRGIQFQVPFENRSFRMATGAIRLAAMAGADLIPCLITETATWKFALHFGAPVPPRYLGDAPDLEAVGIHLLGEFSKVITRYPEQCRSRLLSAISPLSVEEGADRPVAGPATELTKSEG